MSTPVLVDEQGTVVLVESQSIDKPNVSKRRVGGIRTTHQISPKFTEGEYEVLRVLARNHRVSVTAFCRACVVDAIAEERARQEAGQSSECVSIQG